MMRIYFVESAAQSDWIDERQGQALAQTSVACLRETKDDAQVRALERDPKKLGRDLLRRAIRFVNDNLDSKLRWDEIAGAVGLDPFSFGRGFKLATGITPRQYIIRSRLRRAMRLLTRNDLTLAEVALEVGCSCQSHLTTLFRKHLGTTPGAFRVSARERVRRADEEQQDPVTVPSASSASPLPRACSG